NEFFDAIPIRQYEFRNGEWFERCVGLEEGRLFVGLTALSHISSSRRKPGPNTPRDEMVESLPGQTMGPGFLRGHESLGGVFEDHTQRDAIAAEIGALLARVNGAALIIDYGHLKSAAGDTLQAVRMHQQVNILDSPGEADLTAHVDFEAMGRALASAGGSVA